MLRLFVLSLLVLTVFSPVDAQPLNFGEPFAVTATRYKTSGGFPRLVSNGEDVFLFWGTAAEIRASRYVAGETRVGRLVLQQPGVSSGFDVVWTGTHFLVATHAQQPNRWDIVARLVDRNGTPVGDTFTIREGQQPHLASNGRQTVLVYIGPGGYYSELLDNTGRPIAGTEQPLIGSMWPLSLIPTQSGFLVLSASMPGEAARLTSIDASGRVQIERDYAGRILNVALATNGQQFLAVWQDQDTLIANLLSANGTIVNSRVVHVSSATQPVSEWVSAVDAAWSGSEWTVSYRTNAANFHVVHLDRQLTQETLREKAPMWSSGTTSLLPVNGRVLAAWTPRGASASTSIAAAPPIFITTLPLATVGEAASFAPAQQFLLATAASDDATLIVWRESGDQRDALWAGVRRSDGTWSERELAPTTRSNVAAGSDGREFIIVADRDTDTAVYRLDSNGAPIGTTVVTPLLRATDVAWNGRSYVVASGGPTVHSLSPIGTLTATKSLANDFGLFSSIASNGDGFYTAWTIGGHILCTCPPYSVGIAGIPLRGDLTPDAATSRKFEEGGPSAPSVVWDGQAYVVVWSDFDGVFASRVPSVAELPLVATTIAATTDAVDVTAAAVSGGTAILWRTYSDSMDRVRFLHRDGTLSQPVVLGRVATRSGEGAAELEPLGTNRLAYVYTELREVEPHGGASRIMMRIGTASVPPRAPEAPQLRGGLAGRRSFVVEWEAPPQHVHGYRLETRIAGGAWNEVQTFFAPDNRRYVHDTQFGLDVQFRVRAINDGGTGAYSNIISIPVTKRRVVR